MMVTLFKFLNRKPALPPQMQPAPGWTANTLPHGRHSRHRTHPLKLSEITGGSSGLVASTCRAEGRWSCSEGSSDQDSSRKPASVSMSAALILTSLIDLLPRGSNVVAFGLRPVCFLNDRNLQNILPKKVTIWLL